MDNNTQVILAKRPIGLPVSTDFSIEKNSIPELQDGQFLMKTLYISLDPAMRGWMNDARSYIPPVKLGDVMRAGTLGEVVASKHPDYKVGNFVTGWTGVQSHAISNGEGIFRVYPEMAELPTFLSVLGMPGMTAYFGLMDIGEPKEGETLLVSGAAGAVGSVVGQIAKIKGCRVVGIAGGPEKCRFLTEELGFDAAIDYKNEDIKKAVKAHCPDRIDIYFDNVGGEILDIALGRINMKARIVICGAISQYNNTDDIKGPSNYLSLLVSRARMEGFVVMDYAKQYKNAAMEMAQWMAAGKLKNKVHIEEGIENFPAVLLRLFNGNKMGKLVLKV